MSRPLVSIIIPVYNAAGTIKEAIESVLHQSYLNRELIIIDGLSSDGSIDIIRSFEKDISHFSSEKDTGVYSAINKGIDKAKGEWIYILGADDRLANDKVLESGMLQLMGSEQLAFGFVQNHSIQNSHVKAEHRSSFGSGLYWRNTIHQQSAFYHKTLFENFRFDESMKVLADYDFHLRLFTEKKIRAKELGFVIADCEAQGLSKHFGWSLYAEELRMKKKRLGVFLWLLNIPVVIGKFLYKKT